MRVLFLTLISLNQTAGALEVLPSAWGLVAPAPGKKDGLTGANICVIGHQSRQRADCWRTQQMI